MNRVQLAERIASCSVLHGSFTLRSGRTSSWYIDKYRFTTLPDVLEGLAKLATQALPEGTDRVAGAELGGVPLAASVAIAANKPCLFVRNQKKDYGTAQRFEGALEDGDGIVLLEDIATSGGQAIEAAKDLEAAGATVLGILVMVDRLQGAREAVEAAGFRFDALFDVRDLGIDPDQD
ncbi:MAG: orotate phosphoribosyltransferase [Phycisphaerales bacterium]|nr:orotate phosphoribosyltransferase [Phycisphaerales bacterium]